MLVFLSEKQGHLINLSIIENISKRIPEIIEGYITYHEKN